MHGSDNVFDWLLADQLAACAHPASVPELREVLLAQRIGRLVNLDEEADTPELLESLGADAVHLPVPDFTPPTQQQLRQGVAAISTALAAGTRVVVHCRGGLGRTGTLLAAYLVTQGRTPSAAIAEVRAARPGSIETQQQEAAVHRFADDLGS
ncbi:MAG TPA: dual specificity protein phosphatase family protein [Chloroflexota bacterium]|jgi:atypical dual specificity phosphatase|nr:dual specificity protein phosphatase family protein [Chloroflexota bacterium]